MLANWLDDAADLAAFPAKNGEWRLNSLRWTVLTAILDATIVTPALVETLRGSGDGFGAAGLSDPVPLSPRHEVETFACGVEKLDKRLRDAADRVRSGVAPPVGQVETYVVVARDTVAAYYAVRPILAIHATEAAKAPITLLLVAALGVDRRWRSPTLAQSLIGHLIAQAFERADAPAAVIASAITPRVRGLFRRCGARPLGDALHPHGMLTTREEAAAARGL